MNLPQPVRPTRPTNRLVKLTVELSNTRTDRGKRLRNRTETYVIGLLPGLDVNSFTPPGNPFTFCCYRALLLGDPTVIIRATVQPGRHRILTDPLAPQPLQGEDAVESRGATRLALLFRMQRPGGFTTRHFF